MQRVGALPEAAIDRLRLTAEQSSQRQVTTDGNSGVTTRCTVRCQTCRRVRASSHPRLSARRPWHLYIVGHRRPQQPLVNPVAAQRRPSEAELPA